MFTTFKTQANGRPCHINDDKKDTTLVPGWVYDRRGAARDAYEAQTAPPQTSAQLINDYYYYL